MFERHGTQFGGKRAHPVGIGTADASWPGLHFRIDFSVTSFIKPVQVQSQRKTPVAFHFIKAILHFEMSRMQKSPSDTNHCETSFYVRCPVTAWRQGELFGHMASSTNQILLEKNSTCYPPPPSSAFWLNLSRLRMRVCKKMPLHVRWFFFFFNFF